MSDEDKALVEQLYDQADRRHGSVGSLHSLEWKAATRIEAQAAEIEKLREALRGIDVYGTDTLSGRVKPEPETYKDWLIEGVIEMRNRARAALGETK